MNTRSTKSSKYLAHSELEFNMYHIQTARLIHSLLEDRNFKIIGEIVNKFPTNKDREFVHFAFLDQYGYGYMKKIQSILSDKELEKFGFIKKN